MYEVLRKENSNIVYYVDIEKGVVAAVMEDAKDSILSEFEDIDALKFVPHSKWLVLYESLPYKISAKATCHENDEFDLEKGMKIARIRLLKKYYFIFTKFCCEVENEMEKLLEPLDALTIKVLRQHKIFSEAANLEK